MITFEVHSSSKNKIKHKNKHSTVFSVGQLGENDLKFGLQSGLFCFVFYSLCLVYERDKVHLQVKKAGASFQRNGKLQGRLQMTRRIANLNEIEN